MGVLLYSVLHMDHCCSPLRFDLIRAPQMWKVSLVAHPFLLAFQTCLGGLKPGSAVCMVSVPSIPSVGHWAARQ